MTARRVSSAPALRVALAVIVDLCTISSLVASAVLAPAAPIRELSMAAAAMTLAWSVLALTREGRTLGLLLAGIRLVDRRLGVAPGLWPGRRPFFADVRNGLDPHGPTMSPASLDGELTTSMPQASMPESRHAPRVSAYGPASTAPPPSAHAGAIPTPRPFAPSTIAAPPTRDAEPLRAGELQEHTVDVRAELAASRPQRNRIAPLVVATRQQHLARRSTGANDTAVDLGAIRQELQARQDAVLLVIDDDQRVEVTGVAIIGRAPSAAPGEQVVTLPDLSRRMSKSHARIEPGQAGSATVTDLGSTNGTALRRGDEIAFLEPQVPAVWLPGWELLVGDRSIALAPNDRAAGLPTITPTINALEGGVR